MATKEEILEYVTNTPENTNRNVLNSMLDNYNSGSGGEGSGLVINITPVSDTEARADKTWGEIQTAFDSGRPVFMNLQLGRCPVYVCANLNGAYSLRYFVYSAHTMTDANVTLTNEGATAEDYPVITFGGSGGGGGVTV